MSENFFVNTNEIILPLSIQTLLADLEIFGT